VLSCSVTPEGRLSTPFRKSYYLIVSKIRPQMTHSPLVWCMKEDQRQPSQRKIKNVKQMAKVSKERDKIDVLTKCMQKSPSLLGLVTCTCLISQRYDLRSKARHFGNQLSLFNRSMDKPFKLGLFMTATKHKSAIFKDTLPSSYQTKPLHVPMTHPYVCSHLTIRSTKRD
jgi:hypothetical protein